MIFKPWYQWKAVVQFFEIWILLIYEKQDLNEDRVMFFLNEFVILIICFLVETVRYSDRSLQVVYPAFITLYIPVRP